MHIQRLYKGIKDNKHLNIVLFTALKLENIHFNRCIKKQGTNNTDWIDTKVQYVSEHGEH